MRYLFNLVGTLYAHRSLASRAKMISSGLINHIPLREAYDTLHKYSSSSLYKKSSSTFEGMLPVEGRCILSTLKCRS